jgi:hypothetical protein
MTRAYHKRLPEFESFDRIELDIVDRFKISSLSGDEWRHYVRIRFYFKGEVVYEAGYRDMRTAIMLLGSDWIRNQEPIPPRIIELERTKCDQPGCCADAVSVYRLRQEFSERGESLDPTDSSATTYRRFCKRHLRRGDCSREDCDNNYEVSSGPGPDGSTNVIESPASVLVVGDD